MSSRIDFFYYAFRNVLFVSVPLVIISTIILSLPHSSATNSGSGTDSLTISISSACTLSSAVDSEHSTNTNVGTYTSDIGRTTITTLCNDGNGYSVYVVGYSNNEEGNNKLINSEYPQYSIDTGLNTSGLTSQWAMKLNNIPDDPSPTPPTIESDYNNTYGIVPPYWTKVASLPARATDMIKGSSFTTTYAVYTSSSQYAGTYNGQVKYMLVHPNINKPTLNSLESAFASRGIQPAYQDESGSYFAMQDMTTEICNSVSGNGESATTQLVDIRDNKLYWVTKLKDGHCWMTQNLDFDINSNTILNSTTTDLNAIYNSSTGQYAEYDTGYTESNDIIYWAPAVTAKTINFEGTTVTGWQNSNTTPYSANKTDSTETGHALLGNYYNWTTAIASNDSSSLTQNTLSDISKNPKNSICPKGWRLPTISNQSEIVAGSTNEFARLGDLYGVSNILLGPIYFTKNGNTYNESLANTQNGYYWSSTYLSQQTKSCADIINDTLRNASHDASNGFPIRCVAR